MTKLQHCQCCERELKPGTEVMLELDQRVSEYHDFGGVPADRSQGLFPFGKSCAAAKRREAKVALRAYEHQERTGCELGTNMTEDGQHIFE